MSNSQRLHARLDKQQRASPSSVIAAPQADNASEKTRRWSLFPFLHTPRKAPIPPERCRQYRDQSHLRSEKTERSLCLSVYCRPKRDDWKQYETDKPLPFRKGRHANRFRQTMPAALPEQTPRAPNLECRWNRRTIRFGIHVFGVLCEFSENAA